MKNIINNSLQKYLPNVKYRIPPEKFTHKLKKGQGVLLFGEFGTGKTSLIPFLVHYFEQPFFYVTATKLGRILHDNINFEIKEKVVIIEDLNLTGNWIHPFDLALLRDFIDELYRMGKILIITANFPTEIDNKDYAHIRERIKRACKTQIEITKWYVE